MVVVVGRLILTDGRAAVGFFPSELLHLFGLDHTWCASQPLTTWLFHSYWCSDRRCEAQALYMSSTVDWETHMTPRCLLFARCSLSLESFIEVSVSAERRSSRIGSFAPYCCLSTSVFTAPHLEARRTCGRFPTIIARMSNGIRARGISHPVH